MTRSDDYTRLGRRAFLKNGSLVLATATLSSGPLFADDSASSLRVGLVTDLHYADKPPVGSRHYREAPGKLKEAAMQFGGHDLAFAVELGQVLDLPAQAVR